MFSFTLPVPPPAGVTDYNDLENKPTLGTMAAQDADAVNITGGTMTGVTQQAPILQNLEPE